MSRSSSVLLLRQQATVFRWLLEWLRCTQWRRMVMGGGPGKNGLHFRHCDHREKADEDQEKGGEYAKSADEGHDIDPGRVVHTPARRQKVTGQRNGDDDKPLVPHTCIHAHADKEDGNEVATKRAAPKKLRDHYVTSEHRPGGPPIRTEIAIDKSETLEWIGPIKRDEEIHGVGITHDRTGEQNDLTHHVDVIPRDYVVQLVDRPRRQHERQHHGESTENLAGHETGRKNRLVPTRHETD